MKKFALVIVGLVAASVLASYAVSTVSSHSPPALVDEINTALANPSVTTLTASGLIRGGTVGLSATQYFKIVGTTQLVFIAGAVTNVIDADITTP